MLAPLTALLSDTDSRVRAAAAGGLGRIKGEEAVEAVVAQLSQEADGEARRAQVKALQAMASPKAIPALVAVLLDPAGQVAWQAAKALQELRWEPNTDAERASWHLAVSQFEDAVSFGAAAVEPLTRLTRANEFQRCIRAVESLAKVGGAPSVKPLLDCLSNKDFTVRSAAATALGEVGDARAIDPLVLALKDSHHQVCLASCISLGKMGDQRAVEPIIRLLSHGAPDVRAAAVSSLGKLRDARAVPPLVQLLRDSDVEVREAAAAALGGIGDERAIEDLVLTLTDRHSNVRQSAANALRRIEPYWERSEAAFRAIPNLQTALKSKEYWVRHAAADTLKKLGVAETQDSKVPMDSDGALRKRHAALLVLQVMLADRDREFRQAASEALGRIGLSDSIPMLVERLSDTDRGVRASAARSLESLRWQPELPVQKARQLIALERWPEVVTVGPGAIHALTEELARKEPQRRRKAIEILVQVGGAQSAAALRGFTSDPDAALREEAEAALVALESTRSSGHDAKDAWSEQPLVP